MLSCCHQSNYRKWIVCNGICSPRHALRTTKVDVGYQSRPSDLGFFALLGLTLVKLLIRTFQTGLAGGECVGLHITWIEPIDPIIAISSLWV
jgi:hypothetical protein